MFWFQSKVAELSSSPELSPNLMLKQPRAPDKKGIEDNSKIIFLIS